MDRAMRLRLEQLLSDELREVVQVAHVKTTRKQICNGHKTPCCSAPHYRCLLFFPHVTENAQWMTWEGEIENDPGTVWEDGYLKHNYKLDDCRLSDGRLGEVCHLGYQTVKALHDILQQRRHEGCDSFYTYELTTAWAIDQTDNA